MSDVLKEGLINIATIYVNKYVANPEGTEKFFCNAEVATEIMSNVYGYLSNANEIKKIEDLDEEQKSKLWESAKAVCPDASKEKMIKLCKTFWLINSILEK